jgi:tetratricopeptide (TPR) repeat protein
MDRSRPTVGLALIARDEAGVLPGLLASIEGAFDQVVLMDTGSRDATPELFCDWATEEGARNPGFSRRLERFAWNDDFALARNKAQELLSTDWIAWADADDELRGAESLRELAASAPPEVAGFSAHYDYARTGGDQALVDQWRIRMVRAGCGRWRYPVHEQQVVEGRVELLPPERVRWVHRKPVEAKDARRERNVRILRRWLAHEPESLRALGYLGREEALRGDHESAVALFRRYSEVAPWDGERVLVHRQLSLSLMTLGRLDEARAAAVAAAEALPDWADSHLTLAEVALERGDAEAAIEHATRALELGRPDPAVAVAPAWYTLHPRVLLARALRESGREEDAAAMALEGLEAGFR